MTSLGDSAKIVVSVFCSNISFISCASFTPAAGQGAPPPVTAQSVRGSQCTIFDLFRTCTIREDDREAEGVCEGEGDGDGDVGYLTVHVDTTRSSRRWAPRSSSNHPPIILIVSFCPTPTKLSSTELEWVLNCGVRSV